MHAYTITQFLFVKKHNCVLRNKVNNIKTSATKIQLQPLQRTNSTSNIKKLHREKYKPDWHNRLPPKKCPLLLKAKL